MTIDRLAPTVSTVDVLDRVLDKGIVIDAWVQFSLVGISLVTLQERVVVASIQTYLQYSESLAHAAASAPPPAPSYS
jgi:hypothetical protein